VRSFYQGNKTDVVQKMSQNTLLQYYKGVKDSASYLRMAIPFYNNYFMSVSVDSIARQDSLQRTKLSGGLPPNFKNEELERLLKEAKQNGKATTTVSKQLVTNAANISPLATYYGNNLNEGAWTIYTFTKDITLLNKALLFSKKSNEFFVNPEAMDTYARLLYVTGNKSEAINWETKAISAAKARGTSINNEFAKVLAKMQAGENKIDAY